MRCAGCDKSIPEGSVVCPHCAVPQPRAAAGNVTAFDEAATSLEVPTTGPYEAPTSLSSQPGGDLPQSDSGHHGRFLPGTTVAGRYRVVGLLGRGGMGEVYRADDLKLGQQVALKFLPGSMVDDADSVGRLFDEVRMARKVSHPNVCRVFDVGETDGQHYVSMEYVDGEDLSSLLRRIGRLPEDKAIEISRQLCAALAAAHDEGVLHRDLKPANVMLDGRGRVKLTDFGLAAVNEVRAGTPIYMAPEQLAGEGVSVRSDLYSLGLVLHELFTGKRLFEAGSFDELSRQHRSAMSRSLTHTSGLDVAVDRVIERCLEKDPAKRPASALAVAAGLPGGDPLAAALAAGETPSPEMVAEAGGEGSLSLGVAAPLWLLALVAAIGVGVLQAGLSLAGWVPMDLTPNVLDARAREVVRELGYEEDAADTAAGFTADMSYLSWVRREGSTPERLALVDSGRTPLVSYWWRSSPQTLVPRVLQGVGIGAVVSLAEPPRITPGMISLQLDTLGRLTWLDAVPPRVDVVEASTPPDWSVLFALMDLEINRFAPVPPRLTPPHFADARAAWEGRLPDAPESTLRIEAAALGGRPILLRTFADDRPLEQLVAAANAPNRGLAAAAIAILGSFFAAFFIAVFGGLYVARRNVRSGRGDTRGARRLGFAVAGIIGAAWLLGEHSYSAADINELFEMMIFASAIGGLTWTLYLAVEPFMRRHAPQALIGWTRFVDGRFADPLVGRDILFGCVAGVVARLVDLTPLVLGDRVETSGNYVGLPLASTTELFSQVIGSGTIYVQLALGLLFLYGLTYVAVGRRAWLAYALWVVLFAAPGFVGGLSINGLRPSATWLTAIFWSLGWALWLWVLFHRGILAFLVMSTAWLLLSLGVPTMDLTAWYSQTVIAGLGTFAALATYGFYRAARWNTGLADALGGD